MRGIFGTILNRAGGAGRAGVAVGALGPRAMGGASSQGVFSVTPVGGVTKSQVNSRAKNFSSLGARGTGPPVEGDVSGSPLVSRLDQAAPAKPAAAPPAAAPSAILPNSAPEKSSKNLKIGFPSR